MATLIVSSNVVSSGLIVTSGEIVQVLSAIAYLTASTAVHTVVNVGGYEIVSAGSKDSGSVIYGTENVQSGSTGLDETVAGSVIVWTDAIAITTSGIVSMGEEADIKGSLVFAGGPATLEILFSTTPQRACRISRSGIVATLSVRRPMGATRTKLSTRTATRALSANVRLRTGSCAMSKN